MLASTCFYNVEPLAVLRGIINQRSLFNKIIESGVSWEAGWNGTVHDLAFGQLAESSSKQKQQYHLKKTVHTYLSFLLIKTLSQENIQKSKFIEFENFCRFILCVWFQVEDITPIVSNHVCITFYYVCYDAQYQNQTKINGIKSYLNLIKNEPPG